MLTKKIALKISLVVLFLAGLMDIKKGFAHTFNVWYSAEHLAGIEAISDSLVLMSAFGMSNFPAPHNLSTTPKHLRWRYGFAYRLIFHMVKINRHVLRISFLSSRRLPEQVQMLPQFRALFYAFHRQL